MTGLHYRIIVRNFSSTTQHFHLFQKAASFHSSLTINPVLSSSLGCQAVGNHESTGAEISFELSRQIYAGAISVAPAVPLSQSMKLSTDRMPRLPVNSTRAVRQIELTSVKSDNALNCTTLTLDPLGMSQPVNHAGIPVGGFGATVPSYDPAPIPALYWGVAALNSHGDIVLSSCINPQPNSTIACVPEQIFFVKTGFRPDGDVLFYDESNSARCDFTTGFTRITVNYNADGTFSTSSE